MKSFALLFTAISLTHAAPDYSLVGFATLNGGTSGGKGGQVVTAKTLAELQNYAGSTTPYIIMVEGTISNGTAGAKLSVKSNKSIIGVGSSAFLQGIGVSINNANNVILQNVKVTLVGTSNPNGVNGGDAISVTGTSKNIWIDHCEVYSEDPDVQTNIDKYDGLIDIRDQTGYITLSWNYIHDHHKAVLVGASDTDLFAERNVTIHHNYFYKVVKRTPMMRGATGHLFNNYIYGTGTASGDTEASFAVKGVCFRVEKSHYENVRYAIYSATDATKGYAERIDNIASQSRAWPGTCTATIPYSYASVLTTTTADVKNLVKQYAGIGKLNSSALSSSTVLSSSSAHISSSSVRLSSSSQATTKLALAPSPSRTIMQGNIQGNLLKLNTPVIGKANLTIFDHTGQFLHLAEIQDSRIIPLPGLQTGSYIIRIDQNGALLGSFQAIKAVK